MTAHWLAPLFALAVAVMAACGPGPAPGQSPEPITSPPAQGAASPAKEWRTYHNRDYGYTIRVAPDWRINESSKDEVIIFIDRQTGLAGLHILALNWSQTAEEFVDSMVDFHHRRSKALFEPVSRNAIMMASGARAEQFRYRIQTASKFCVEHVVDVLLVAGRRGYALQGAVCEEAAPVYMKAIETMQRSFALDSGRASLPPPAGQHFPEINFRSSSHVCRYQPPQS
jgi:hypothetical protein